ncbi:MAG: hypothetical protein K6A63_01355, partial [Acholeplasmatales bacterium]|nr:hypothetical protein [Acholeplasmatales bacterium]
MKKIIKVSALIGALMAGALVITSCGAKSSKTSSANQASVVSSTEAGSSTASSSTAQASSAVSSSVASSAASSSAKASSAASSDVVTLQTYSKSYATYGGLVRVEVKENKLESIFVANNIETIYLPVYDGGKIIAFNIMAPTNGSFTQTTTQDLSNPLSLLFTYDENDNLSLDFNISNCGNYKL